MVVRRNFWIIVNCIIQVRLLTPTTKLLSNVMKLFMKIVTLLLPFIPTLTLLPTLFDLFKWSCQITLQQVECLWIPSHGRRKRDGGCNTAQKMKFPADLVTFTEEILNGKLHFLCIVSEKFNVYSERESSGWILLGVYGSNHPPVHSRTLLCSKYQLWVFQTKQLIAVSLKLYISWQVMS